MASGHIDQLEKLIATNPNASGTEAKLVLARVASEIQDRLASGTSNSVDFFVSAMRAICRIRGSANYALRLSSLWECGRFFEMHGLYGPAVELVDALEDLAKKSADTAWLRKSYTLGGIVHAEFGNVAEALIRHARSCELAQTEGKPFEIGALTNTAVALNYAGLHREAIQCCQRAVDISRTATDSLSYQNAAFALCNMALGHLYLDEHRDGLIAIRECLARTEEPSDNRLALSCTIREWTFIQLALELDLIDEAHEHTLVCRRYSAKWGDNARLAGLAAVADALCQVYAGDVPGGLATLENVLATATSSTSPHTSLHEDARRALIRAYELVGHPEKALKNLTALMSEIGARKQLILEGVLDWGRTAAFNEELDSRALRFREAKLRARVAEIELINSRLEMLERLAITADLREESSGQHGYRVGRLCALLAANAGMTPDAVSALEISARLHDIGKVGIPDRILLTTQELKDAERHLMSSHALIGAELLARSDIPQLRMAEDIARYHHESWDGSGYPAKLAGKRIPIHARIVALADVFDALTHGRPYAPAWPIEKALEEIQARRGTQFDPELTDKFIELVHRLQSEHADLDEFLGRAGRNSPFAQARNRIRLMLEEGRERIDKQVAPASETVH